MPTTVRLDQVASHLAAKGDHRSLISLVERWGLVGEPSRAARVAQARAFVELRVLDRAWVRLKDLVEVPEPDLEALALAVEMFLLRGWQNQARKAVARGLERAPDSALFRGLNERAHETPTEPDEEGLESDQTPIADLIRTAEQFMAHGAFLRARTLLERVRRKVPEHRWAADLLWAIDGDFAGGDTTLADLCDRLGPDVSFGDLQDEPEHTESVHVDDLPLQLDEEKGGFPSLFRNLDGRTEAYASANPEVTAVSSMEDLGPNVRDTDPAESTDPNADDTQIVRVVHKSGDAEPSSSTAVDGFNLADYRRQMGVATPPVNRDYLAGPEDEDDSVVVHTRHDDLSDGGEATPTTGTAVLLDTANEAAARSLLRGDDDERWANAPTEVAPARTPVPGQRTSAPGRTPTPTARTAGPNGKARARSSLPPPPPPPPKSASRSGAPPLVVAAPTGGLMTWPWWVAVIGVLFALSVLTFMLFVFLMALS